MKLIPECESADKKERRSGPNGVRMREPNGPEELEKRNVGSRRPLMDGLIGQECRTCATIAVRVVHFVFSMMCLICAFTVGSVMPNSFAISLFVKPLERF